MGVLLCKGVGMRRVDEQDVGVEVMLGQLLYRIAFDECPEMLEVWNTLLNRSRSPAELRVNNALSRA